MKVGPGARGHKPRRQFDGGAIPPCLAAPVEADQNLKTREVATNRRAGRNSREPRAGR